MLSEEELKASKVLVALLKEIYKHSTEDALTVIDLIASSGSNCKYYLPYVRQSMWYLSRAGRVADAKRFADIYLASQNRNDPQAWNDQVQREYDDICLRIRQALITPEPSESYYNSVYNSSEHYSGNPYDSIYINVWQKVAKRFEARLIQENLSCLDIGCGPGQFAEYLCQHLDNLRYVGIDTSSVAILQAKERTPNATFICNSLNHLPSSLLHEIDIFLALEVLEHIVDDLGMVKTLPARKEVIFSVPNFDSFGHVRFFANASRVYSRYSPLFLNLHVEPVFLGKGKSVIYICHGIKL